MQFVVPVGPDLAFSVFADEIGAWWPLPDPGTALGLRDWRLLAVEADGTESTWATVVEWEPPRALRLAWPVERVDITFVEVAPGLTLVTVPPVLDAAMAGYQRLAGQGAHEFADNFADGEVWLVLRHTRGPAAGPDSPSPDHPEHLAFLRTLRDEGLLVAAGPLDGDDEGMAVVRLPSADNVAELVRRAQSDDLSVVLGVLQVRVQPWRVALHT